MSHHLDQKEQCQRNDDDADSGMFEVHLFLGGGCEETIHGFAVVVALTGGSGVKFVIDLGFVWGGSDFMIRFGSIRVS